MPLSLKVGKDHRHFAEKTKRNNILVQTYNWTVDFEFGKKRVEGFHTVLIK